MRLGQDLRLVQSQRLVVTPELRQAIKILRLTSLELAAYLQEQVLQNPLLELVEDAASAETGEPTVSGEETPEEEPAPQSQDEPEDWVEYFQDSSDLGYLGPRERPADQPSPVETIPDRTAGLTGHLLLQLHLLPLAQEVVRGAEAVIEALDEDGYLRTGLGLLGETVGVGADDLDRALGVVQQMDPPGVGARDLRECLLLQLGARGMKDSLAARIVGDHLEDVAASRLGKIASALSEPAARVQSAVEVIRGLEPRPGAVFSRPDSNRYVIPDVIIERVAGDYVVVLNDSIVPRLRINPFYRRLVSAARASGGAPEADRNGEAAEFLGRRLRSALWLLRCIEQRRTTLHRVVESIAGQQRAFLDHGIRHLRPLTLKDVAADVGVHESTVSRAIAGKYAQTPRGTFELRFFFGSGLASRGGGRVSSRSVKRVIRELIEAEDPRSPHSDQKLVELLERRGASLSRRTVTKYRKELGLPASTRRRRY